MSPLGLLALLAAAPLRVVIAEPADPELARRVQNQVSDLPIELVSIVEPARTATTAFQRARRLAARVDGADVAAFVDVDAEKRFLLTVADLRSSTVMARRFSSSKKKRTQLRGSAVRESVALALRASLQALAYGGEIAPEPELEDDIGDGDEAGEAVDRTWIREVAPRARPETSTPELGRLAGGAAERVEPTAPTARVAPTERDPGKEARGDEAAPREADPGRSIPLSVFVGWGLGAAGRGLPLTQALVARGAAGFDRLELGLQLELGAPTELIDARAEVGLARHAALALGAVRFEPDARVHVLLRAGVGASLQRRTTVARDPRVVAAPASTGATFTAHAGAALRTRLFSRFGIELAPGLDVVPGAPRLAYQRGEAVEVRARFWIFQPRFQIGVFLSDL